MKSSPTFRGWLAQQRGRPDPVGDLADDVLADRYRVSSPAALARHLEDVGAHPGAHRAVELAGREWAELNPPKGPRAPKGFAAAGRHHGHPLAKHRRTGRLIVFSDGEWENVAKVIKATSHQVYVECPNGCEDRRKPKPHYHGRAGDNGEGGRVAHCGPCYGVDVKTDYFILDLDDLCASVPVCRCHRDHLAVCSRH